MGRLLLADQLEQIRAKVLIVRGQQDALTTSEVHALGKLAREHEHINIAQIQGVGHYPQLESPKKLAETIRPILSFTPSK